MRVPLMQASRNRSWGVPAIRLYGMQSIDYPGSSRLGWQFKQMILPSSDWGKSDSMVAILERTSEAG
jgi:hypothetical protein